MHFSHGVTRAVLIGALLAGLGCAPAVADSDGVGAEEQSKRRFSGVVAYDAGDYAKALREFRLLAERGDAAGQNMLGIMYVHGQGVPQDDKQAVDWFRKAAAQGNAAAKSSLGVMYYKGRGVPQDYVLAYALWNVGAIDRDKAVDREKSASYRNAIANEMSPSQIAEGQSITHQLTRAGEFLKALDAAAAR